MNNWRLLLFAVVAVLQPIGSYTEQYLIDGHQECCDHGSNIRDNIYGTLRKNVHDQRVTRLTERPDFHENRRYESRDAPPILRRSVQGDASERRYLADHERLSRDHGSNQREYSESTNLEQSRIRDSRITRYERASFLPTRHVSRIERAARDLSRDSRDAGSERQLREIELREARLTENRRINSDRYALSPNLRENRASIFEERRSQETRFSVPREHRERNSDDIIMSKLRKSREQRLEPKKSVNLSRNFRSVQSRDDKMINKRADQRRERETYRMSENRAASRLRESREQRLEPQRSINLTRNVRSVQSRIEDTSNKRLGQRRERETNRMSNDRIALSLRESRVQRLEPHRDINLVRNIRSLQSRDENRINERLEQRREHETKRMSDDRVESRMRVSLEGKVERQRAINLARNYRPVQSRDEDKINERIELRRERLTNRLSNDRVVLRLRESREKILSQDIRSVQNRHDNRINERADQRRERDTTRISDDRAVSRQHDSREQRLKPQRASSLSRNIRYVQIREENRINNRDEQRRERQTSRVTNDRVMSSLRESRQQRLEPQRATSFSRNIRSVQSRDENMVNERADQRRERETSRMSDDSVGSRLRESRQSPEERLESHRFVRQSRNIKSDHIRYEDRVNERIEQRRQRESNRISEERLMSRLRESHQTPKERLDQRTRLSRIDDKRNRQEVTRRQSNRISERSEAREQSIRESRDRMAPENRDSIRDHSRISRSFERNDERLHGERRISAEQRQDAYRMSRILPMRDASERNEGERNRDFRSSQREVTRELRSVERADSRRQIEGNRATRSVIRNFEEQRSRSAIPSTHRDVRNEREFRYRGVSNRERELKSEMRESEMHLKSSEMVMERIDRTRESRNRIQNDRISTVRETLMQDKFEKPSSDMSWQYLFYTLQGAYLCGLLVQMVTEKSMKSKTSNLSWWNPVSNNLIKVD